MNFLNRIKRISIRPNYKGTFYQRIFRVLAAFIVILLEKTPITPNQVTLFATFLYIFPAWLFLQNSVFLNLVGVIFLYFINVLDKVDGELARLKNLTSKRGIFLDGILTNICDIAIFIPLGIKNFLINGDIYVLIASFICVIALLLQRFNYLNRVNLVGITQNFEINKLQISSNWLKKIGKVISLPNQHLPEILIVFIIMKRIDIFLFFMASYNSILFILYSFILSKFNEETKHN